MYKRQTIHSGQDESSEGQIRGLNVKGALVDEASLAPQSFIEQVITRVRVGDYQKTLLITNPGNEHHWMNKTYIENTPAHVNHIKLQMKDNPTLKPEYIERQRKSLTGNRYLQWFLGEWASIEGVVYPQINRVTTPFEYSARQNWIGVDSGEVNPTHAVKLVSRLYLEDDKEKEMLTVEKEYRHVAQETGPLSCLLYTSPSPRD